MGGRTPSLASIPDLYEVEGQAELIGGRIVRLPLHGVRTGQIVMEIASALSENVDAARRGEIHTSTLGYVVPRLPSGRESFCPDASYYDGPLPKNPMRFIEGPPTLAVEVRSENDHGPAAERAMAAKRADYFAAGTIVVWDVDPEAGVIRAYRASEPDRPAVYGRGERAEAEPAVPGWQIAVDTVVGTA